METQNMGGCMVIQDDIQAILSKYDDQEANIDQLLETRIDDKVREEIECKKIKRQNRVECMEKALNRNKEILKNLEIVKSTLRSKAIYSPSEMQWDDICKRYKEASSLQVTAWRCHVPVFV